MAIDSARFVNQTPSKRIAAFARRKRKRVGDTMPIQAASASLSSILTFCAIVCRATASRLTHCLTVRQEQASPDAVTPKRALPARCSPATTPCNAPFLSLSF